MLAALRVNAQQVTLLPDDRPEELWLVSQDGSWACQTSNGDGDPIVAQDGPVMIWDQIESAYQTWNSLGRPARHTFGLAVTPTGRHTIWHDDPKQQLWHSTDRSQVSTEPTSRSVTTGPSNFQRACEDGGTEQGGSWRHAVAAPHDLADLVRVHARDRIAERCGVPGPVSLYQPFVIRMHHALLVVSALLARAGRACRSETRWRRQATAASLSRQTLCDQVMAWRLQSAALTTAVISLFPFVCEVSGTSMLCACGRPYHQ